MKSSPIPLLRYPGSGARNRKKDWFKSIFLSVFAFKQVLPEFKSGLRVLCERRKGLFPCRGDAIGQYFPNAGQTVRGVLMPRLSVPSIF